MQPSQKIVKALEMLDIAIQKHGTVAAVCRATGIHKATFWRMRNGQSKRVHDATFMAIAKAAL